MSVEDPAKHLITALKTSEKMLMMADGVEGMEADVAMLTERIAIQKTQITATRPLEQQIKSATDYVGRKCK